MKKAKHKRKHHRPGGLLAKAQLVADADNKTIQQQVHIRAADLLLEAGQESREELAEIPDMDLDAAHAAAQTAVKRVEGQSRISLSTGKVTPGLAQLAANAPLERVHTGVPGLDDHIKGGFVEGSINLVMGSPGAGKTMFGAQFLIDGIVRHGEPGLYISFEERKESFLKYAQQFGWDFAKHESDGMFTFLRYTPEQVQRMFADGSMLDSIMRGLGAKRICIDSITAFALLFKDELSAREAVLSLLELLHGWGATAILTAELDAEPERHSSGAVEFEVDSVIALYSFRRRNLRQRVAEIIKMRGTPFKQKVLPVRIDDKGLSFAAD